MSKKDISYIFKRLGMSKHAGIVYEIIHNQGPISPSNIVRSGGIHRPAVYKSLSELSQHKLITTTQKGKRLLWKAGNPKLIIDLFNKESETVAKIIPKQSDTQLTFSSQPIRFFNGTNGITAIFDDVIEHTPRGDTFYRYTSEQDLDTVNSYLSPDYRKFRDKKKLERLVISNPISGEQKRPRLERFIKFISEDMDMFNQNMIQLVYGQRIAIIDLNKLEGIVIESGTLAEFQKVIFKQLYKRLQDAT